MLPDYYGRFCDVWYGVMLDKHGVSDPTYEKLLALGRLCLPHPELAYMRKEVRDVPNSSPPRFYIPLCVKEVTNATG